MHMHLTNSKRRSSHEERTRAAGGVHRCIVSESEAGRGDVRRLVSGVPVSTLPFEQAVSFGQCLQQERSNHMKLTGNTIFITGGGSGIGRGLAEALHKRGNQVIIAGRRKGRLAEVASTNPGMRWVELDIEDPASISAVAGRLIAEYPKLNVLINNAGVMNIHDASAAVDEKLLVTTLTTNFMGPIRMTGALIEQLKRQDDAAGINNS